MARFLLPIVWIAWGISYPLMSWSLEAVATCSRPG